MVDKFQGCTAISCVRQSVGPKKHWQYLIEEECPYGQNGNNTCTYKRHLKIERTDNEREPVSGNPK